MRKLLASTLLLALTTGAHATPIAIVTTPKDRAEAICARLGDPGQGCVNNWAKIERARDEARNRRYGRAAAPARSPSESVAPTSGYDRMTSALKDRCSPSGADYAASGNGVAADCRSRR
jgi:hypothetical protein